MNQNQFFLIPDFSDQISLSIVRHLFRNMVSRNLEKKCTSFISQFIILDAGCPSKVEENVNISKNINLFFRESFLHTFGFKNPLDKTRRY